MAYTVPKDWRTTTPESEILRVGPDREFGSIYAAVSMLNDGGGRVILYDNDIYPSLVTDMRINVSGTAEKPIIIAPANPDPNTWPWFDGGVTRYRDVEAGDKRSDWTTFVLNGDYIVIQGFQVGNVGTFVLRQGTHYDIGMIHAVDVWNDLIHSHSDLYHGDSSVHHIICEVLATFKNANGSWHSSHEIYEMMKDESGMDSHFSHVYGRDISGHVVQIKTAAKVPYMDHIVGLNSRSHVNLYDLKLDVEYHIDQSAWLRDRAPAYPNSEDWTPNGDALLHKADKGHAKMTRCDMVITDPSGRGPIEHGSGTREYKDNLWRVNPNAGASWGDNWPNYGVDAKEKFFSPEGEARQPDDTRIPTAALSDQEREEWLDKWWVTSLAEFYGEPDPPIDPPIEPPTDSILILLGEILDEIRGLHETMKKLRTIAFTGSTNIA